MEIEISDIPVIPSTPIDAEEIFNQFIEEKIVDYISKNDFKSLTDEIKNKLLEYGNLDYDFRTPSQIELAEFVSKRSNGVRPKTYWNLIASIDLSLEGMQYAK